MGDHKPPEVLLNGRGNPSSRIERWRLWLKNYSPRIVYQPGIQNAVDFSSRKPVTTNTSRDPVEEYVNSIIVDSLPSAITLQELLLASECDLNLNTIKEALDTGNSSAAPKPFEDLKDELCQKRGMILRNNRVAIPDALRPRILRLAHEGHQGITKVKQHLRQQVWWPGIDIQAERHVRECLGFQIVGPTPLLPQSPSEWQIDLNKYGTQSILTTVAHSHLESIFLSLLMKQRSTLHAKVRQPQPLHTFPNVRNTRYPRSHQI